MTLNNFNKKKLICGTETGEIFVYDINDTKSCINLCSENKSGLCSIASNNNIIVTGFKDGNICGWKY